MLRRLTRLPHEAKPDHAGSGLHPGFLNFSKREIKVLITVFAAAIIALILYDVGLLLVYDIGL